MVGVLGVRATRLVHEASNHAVEVLAVVEVVLHQVKKIAPRHWHLVHEDFSFDRPCRGVEGDDGIRLIGQRLVKKCGDMGEKTHATGKTWAKLSYMHG